MERLRTGLTYALLRGVKGASRLLYHHDFRWVGPVPDDPWADVRVVAVLNHTSLFEPIFAGAVPNRFLRDVAERGVVPVARKTADRAVVGRFFRSVAGNVVSVTRERDESWNRFVEACRDRSAMAVLLPEGRMMRRDGLDAYGQPMTVRGGIADVLRCVEEGRMILAYSGGLHHVHAPGDLLPRLFRTVRMRAQSVDIAAYRRRLLAEAGDEGFKKAVVEDLTRRRDRHCPVGRPRRP